VDERILDGARRVFLERGFADASMEEIASRAGTAKPTLYTRFPGKEALYSAVVMRSVAAAIARLEGHIPTGESINERFASVGAAVLHWALNGDTVDLMRAGVAEARRFPDLASNIHLTARDRGREIVARFLAEVAQSDALGALPAFAPERLAATAQFFMDLILLPMMMRALFGEKLKSLRAEIGLHVARRVPLFLAACRHGGAD
jgi:AcrR family transcriptional regulator